jgi:hypothetical protein
LEVNYFSGEENDYTNGRRIETVFISPVQPQKNLETLVNTTETETMSRDLQKLVGKADEYSQIIRIEKSGDDYAVIPIVANE